MISLLVSDAVDCGFKAQSEKKPKKYEIDIYCFLAKHVTLRRDSKDWLAWNQDSMSEWVDMSTC